MPIRPLVIWSEQTWGLFCDRQTCRREGTGDQIIEGVMSDCFPGALLQIKLWTPQASTLEPQWHSCGTHADPTRASVQQQLSQLRHPTSNRTKQWWMGAEGRCHGNQFSLEAIVVIISIQWINVRKSIHYTYCYGYFAQTIFAFRRTLCKSNCCCCLGMSKGLELIMSNVAARQRPHKMTKEQYFIAI